MAILTAYLDASGSSRDPRVSALTIAGFVAREDAWAEFDREWFEALDGVAELHMRDFAFCRREFENWSDERRSAFLSLLAEVIGKHVVMGVSATVSLLAYRKAAEWYALPDAFHPYGIAAGAAIESIEQWRSPGDRVTYLFEKGDVKQQSILDASLRFFDVDLPSPPGFRSKRCEKDGKLYYCYPFQAADYLGYEHAKYVKDRHADPSKENVRASLNALTAKVGALQISCRYFDLPTYVALCCENRIPSRGRPASADRVDGPALTP